MQMAPTGVIGFIPKSEPMVVTLLSLREDTFDLNSRQTFVAALEVDANVERSLIVSD